MTGKNEIFSKIEAAKGLKNRFSALVENYGCFWAGRSERKKNQFVVNIYLFYFSGSLNTEWDELARVQVFRSVVNLFTVVFFCSFAEIALFHSAVARFTHAQ